MYKHIVVITCGQDFNDSNNDNDNDWNIYVLFNDVTFT